MYQDKNGVKYPSKNDYDAQMAKAKKASKGSITLTKREKEIIISQNIRLENELAEAKALIAQLQKALNR